MLHWNMLHSLLFHDFFPIKIYNFQTAILIVTAKDSQLFFNLLDCLLRLLFLLIWKTFLTLPTAFSMKKLPFFQQSRRKTRLIVNSVLDREQFCLIYNQSYLLFHYLGSLGTTKVWKTIFILLSYYV